MRKPFKIASAIIGLLFLMGLIGAAFASNDKPAPVASAVKPAAANPTAARVTRLTGRAERILQDIVVLADQGASMAQSNPAGSCALVDTQVRKVNQLGDIVEELRPLADADTMAMIDEREANLREPIGETVALCNGMGY